MGSSKPGSSLLVDGVQLGPTRWSGDVPAHRNPEPADRAEVHDLPNRVDIVDSSPSHETPGA